MSGSFQGELRLLVSHSSKRPVGAYRVKQIEVPMRKSLAFHVAGTACLFGLRSRGISTDFSTRLKLQDVRPVGDCEGSKRQAS